MSAARAPETAMAPSELPADDLLRALPGLATGEDPRYGERFASVQAEVARLAGTDFELIIEGCRAVLREEAKDLRVLGYLALARLGSQGLEGLTETLELAAGLVQRFGADLHPQRTNARASAVRFLESDRMLGLLERAPDAGAGEARGRLEAALDALESALAALPDLRTAGLPRLRQALRRLRPVQSADGEVEPTRTAPGASAPGPVPDAAAAVNDEAACSAGLRQALAYLREQRRWPEHAALARAHRWAPLRLPPAQDGVIAVEPPREAALAAVRAAVAESRWEDGLAAAERAFLEPGGQLCLGLQRQGALCAERLGRADVRSLIEAAVRELDARLPGLFELAFRDGTPLSSAEDGAWLARLRRPDAAAGPDGGEVAPGDEERLAAAREVVAREGLAAGLRSLERAAVSTVGRRLACCRLLQADLCLEQERPEVARGLLEGVLEAMRRGGHDLWDAELTLRLVRALTRATERDGSCNAKERRVRLARLREAALAIDPAAALPAAGVRTVTE